MKKYILAKDVGGLFPGEIEPDCRDDLIPRLARAHDLQHLQRSHPAGNAVECPGSAGVRIGAGQNLSGQCQSVFKNHLMTDPVAADVEEFLDPETPRELACNPLASRVTDGRRRNRVVEDDRDLARVGDPLRHLGGSGKDKIDLDYLVDLADDDV